MSFRSDEEHISFHWRRSLKRGCLSRLFSSPANARSTSSATGKEEKRKDQIQEPRKCCPLKLGRAIVGKLHINAEVLLFKEGDDLLKGVAVFAGYAHEIAIDRGLHPQLRFFDIFDDL